MGFRGLIAGEKYAANEASGGQRRMTAIIGSEEAAFRAAILANWQDETARLVYADWLDERGQARPAARLRWWVHAVRTMRADVVWDQRAVAWGAVRGAIGRLRRRWVCRLYVVEVARLVRARWPLSEEIAARRAAVLGLVVEALAAAELSALLQTNRIDETVQSAVRSAQRSLPRTPVMSGWRDVIEATLNMVSFVVADLIVVSAERAVQSAREFAARTARCLASKADAPREEVRSAEEARRMEVQSAALSAARSLWTVPPLQE